MFHESYSIAKYKDERLIKAMNQTAVRFLVHLQMFMSFSLLWAADLPGGGVETIKVSCSPGHGLSKTVKDTFIWRFVRKIWRWGDLTAAYSAWIWMKRLVVYRVASLHKQQNTHIMFFWKSKTNRSTPIRTGIAHLIMNRLQSSL